MQKWIEIEIIIKDLIKILEKEKTKNKNLIVLMQNCKDGKWKNKAYYEFVNSENPNQVGSKWQFLDNVVIEHKVIWTIIIILLKNSRIGGFEFYNLIEWKYTK